jgi:hypothetical protein
VDIKAEFTAIGLSKDGITDEDLDFVAGEIGVYDSANEALSLRSSAAPPLRYNIFPVSGNLNRDIALGNFVDLNRSPVRLAWDCTNSTYNFHNGHDAFIRTLGEQEIGVPIVAARDGVVAATHDGEPDMNDGPFPIRSNYVIIDHGSDRFSWYYHVKRGSVAVSVGEAVKAGQEIGMIGSSGNSGGWPHLHFETRIDRRAYEPFAGPCRPGESGWTEQPQFRTDNYLSDFGFVPVGEELNLPFSPARTGTLLPGFQSLEHWFEVHNIPVSGTFRVRVRRPDGTFAADTGTQPYAIPSFINWGWQAATMPVDLDVTGPWSLIILANGKTMVSAPFDVVADPSEIMNRPPHPIQAYLDPAEYTPDDVIFCRVETDPVLDDPDYDIVRYEYEWFVDGEALRFVTHAGQADAIPHHTIQDGEMLECRVTPSDGILRGDTVTTLCGDLDPTCIRATLNVTSTVKTDRRGVIPVVVFGSENLDVADLDVDSLLFGPDGAATAHDLTDPSKWNEHISDVNRDGFMDLMTHYRVDETGIAPGDESVDLLGLTLDRRPLKASGAIQTVLR